MLASINVSVIIDHCPHVGALDHDGGKRGAGGLKILIKNSKHRSEKKRKPQLKPNHNENSESLPALSVGKYVNIRH